MAINNPSSINSTLKTISDIRGLYSIYKRKRGDKKVRLPKIESFLLINRYFIANKRDMQGRIAPSYKKILRAIDDPSVTIHDIQSYVDVMRVLGYINVTHLYGNVARIAKRGRIGSRYKLYLGKISKAMGSFKFDALKYKRVRIPRETDIYSLVNIVTGEVRPLATA